MSFEIRFAIRKDTPLIYQFILKLAQFEKLSHHVTATVESLEKSLFDLKQAEVLIGEENDLPVSFMLFYSNYSTFLGKANLYIEDVYVDEPYRHKGYGKNLFVHLAKIAIERDCQRIDWSCLNWNEKAIGFYKLLGAKSKDEWLLHRLEKDGIDELASKK